MSDSLAAPEPLAAGVVYTETLVHMAPERYAGEAPYQIAIVEIPGCGRITARISDAASGKRAEIGDPVFFSQWRDGVPYFVTV